MFENCYASTIYIYFYILYTDVCVYVWNMSMMYEIRKICEMLSSTLYIRYNSLLVLLTHMMCAVISIEKKFFKILSSCVLWMANETIRHTMIQKKKKILTYSKVACNQLHNQTFEKKVYTHYKHPHTHRSTYNGIYV